LEEHKALDVIILDLKGIAGWTDFFVIGTCTTSTHLRGLSRFVEEHLHSQEIDTLNKPAIKEDESWILHDCGDVIVHIMNEEARKFYELEKLWYKGAQFSTSEE
jgi:ribosome-associated protein